MAKKSTIPANALFELWREDPEYVAEYERLKPEFELARQVIASRVRAGLSQSELASRMGTSQSAIARLESGRNRPSTSTLERLAKATNSRLQITLVPAT